MLLKLTNVLGGGLLAVAGLSTPLFRSAPVRAAWVVRVVSRVVLPAPLPPVMLLQTLPAHGPTYTLTATTYSAVLGQTDDEPFVTADNSDIPADYSSQIRWIALSHDLLTRWGGPFAYGDTVRLTGLSARLDGVYTIHDTMNRRHHHCLDVLTHPTERLAVFQPGVKIRQVSL